MLSVMTKLKLIQRWPDHCQSFMKDYTKQNLTETQYLQDTFQNFLISIIYTKKHTISQQSIRVGLIQNKA